MLAAALATLGRMDEARSTVERLREHQPDATLAQVATLSAELLRRYKVPLLEGLQKAGFD